MFKSALILKITALPSSTDLEFSASCYEFTPTTPSQERSVGWSPVRGLDSGGALVEHVGTNDLLRFTCEAKSVPSTAIMAKAKERAKVIEAHTGRKPGKKEMKEIKEEVKADLIVHAIPRLTSTMVWIDRASMRLVLDTASMSRYDDITALLMKTFTGLALQPLMTEISPVTAMADWLMQGAPDMQSIPMGDFSVGRQCRLQACDESKAVVTYGRHNLDNLEVRGHIRSGKMPTALELAYNSRITFTLTDSGTLTKLKFMDDVFFGDKPEDRGDAFEADVILMAGELVPMIDSLIRALGGEMVVGSSKAVAEVLV